METATRLDRIGDDRARHLLGQLRPGHDLVLDDVGHVTGTAPANDVLAEHILGDFDVHA